jgi:hypothetical protein
MCVWHTYLKVHQMSKHITFSQKKQELKAKKMVNAARKKKSSSAVAGHVIHIN